MKMLNQTVKYNAHSSAQWNFDLRNSLLVHASYRYHRVERSPETKKSQFSFQVLPHV